MDDGRVVVSMADFVYMVGAVYVASTVARLTFWAVDVIEGRR